jgi:alkanesulfonate monooxygenase SsuD/methylene tetrahydromethanopterin reductase-like flavin-dependent oxidoreductase (luciferase family)
MSTVRIGLDLPADTPEPVAAARTAERLGIDFVSTSDHPIGTAPSYETWTMLSWVAACTTRLGVATRVLSVPLRNPVLLAKMAESLDRLSGGRLVLGLGGGADDDELVRAGLPVPTPRQKVDGLADAVRILRGVWSEPVFSYAGSVHRARAVQLEPKPARPVPVWLGTFGPRALRVTGELADGWIPSLGHAGADRLPAMREAVLAAAADAGRDPAGITCALNVTVRVDGGPGGAGGPGEDAEVAGRPAAVAARLRELVDSGFGTLNLKVPTGQWERLAGEVLPVVRDR